MEKNSKKELVKTLIAQDLSNTDEIDLMELLIEEQLSINVEKVEEAKMTFGDRVADRLSEIAGSWGFIITFSAFLLIWIIINGLMLKNDAIDPYPFILLNLLLSCLAALQAPIIMMSQNRQAKKDTLRNQNDYRTDLKSELILEDLHSDINELIKNQRKILKYIDEKEQKKDNK